MSMQTVTEKLSSRKFWMCAAAFLASVATGISGMVTDNQTILTIGVFCGVLSAAIYATIEAIVDSAVISANATVTTVTSATTVTATSDDNAVVQKVLTPVSTTSKGTTSMNADSSEGTVATS